MSPPLAFEFRIDPPHLAMAIAALRVPAAVRVAVLRAGIETLAELDGMTAGRLARYPGVGAAGALTIVRAVRWRCVHSLPSWELLAGTTADRLPSPLNRVRTAAYGSGPFGQRPGQAATVHDLFALGPDALARRTNVPAMRMDQLFDELARVAELEPAALRAVSACPAPFRMPMIHPLALVALARATSQVERLAALTVGLPVPDSLIVLAHWGFGGASRPAFEALARSFGLTAERVRQIVVEHEQLIHAAGLALDRIGISPRAHR